MGRRCLIVDDNPGFLTTARSVLEGQGMTVVGVASTTEEAVAIAASDSPEVALVDVDLGAENGLDVARALRAGDADVDVILISAYGEKDIQDLMRAAPALGYLSKSVLSRRAIDDLLDADHAQNRPT
jgi:DNA-binding NarL/FixJ family response regulator